MTLVEEESWAARIIQMSWRWSRKRMRIRDAWEVRLQDKIRESERRAVAKIFKELQAILKAEEERGRKLLTEELASLELDCDLQGRKINFTNSKTLVGPCRDRP